jgi:hypothetical protein
MGRLLRRLLRWLVRCRGRGFGEQRLGRSLGCRSLVGRVERMAMGRLVGRSGSRVGQQWLGRFLRSGCEQRCKRPLGLWPMGLLLALEPDFELDGLASRS